MYTSGAPLNIGATESGVLVARSANVAEISLQPASLPDIAWDLGAWLGPKRAEAFDRIAQGSPFIGVVCLPGESTQAGMLYGTKPVPGGDAPLSQTGVAMLRQDQMRGIRVPLRTDNLQISKFPLQVGSELVRSGSQLVVRGFLELVGVERPRFRRGRQLRYDTMVSQIATQNPDALTFQYHPEAGQPLESTEPLPWGPPKLQPFAQDDSTVPLPSRLPRRTPRDV